MPCVRCCLGLIGLGVVMATRHDRDVATPARCSSRALPCTAHRAAAKLTQQDSAIASCGASERRATACWRSEPRANKNRHYKNRGLQASRRCHLKVGLLGDFPHQLRARSSDTLARIGSAKRTCHHVQYAGARPHAPAEVLSDGTWWWPPRISWARIQGQGRGRARRWGRPGDYIMAGLCGHRHG